jgi:hypothetical protein
MNPELAWMVAIGGDQERSGPLFDEGCKRRIDVTFGTGV